MRQAIRTNKPFRWGSWVWTTRAIGMRARAL
ncbi:hypothetical protein RAD15_42535 [Bradyrhizobium sp. 14AA]